MNEISHLENHSHAATIQNNDTNHDDYLTMFNEDTFYFNPFTDEFSDRIFNSTCQELDRQPLITTTIENFETDEYPYFTINKPNEISKTIKKSKKRIRSSAAKRYPQHVIVGFGRWIKRELENSEQDIVEFINTEILGKTHKHKYKISKVKEVKQLFEIEQNDRENVVKIKNRLKDELRRFWKEGFEKWINEDFKGDDMSKSWLLKNKELIKQKITGNRSRYPQFKSVQTAEKNNKSINSKYLKNDVENSRYKISDLLPQIFRKIFRPRKIE